MTHNIKEVYHKDLMRFSDESMFKSLCSLCGGILLVRRNQPDLYLSRFDNCVKCGQFYLYLDDKIDHEEFDMTVDEYRTKLVVEA
jgi:hypothetical protein